MSNKNLTIYLLNCNSINNKLSEIKKLLLEHEPHIFCLCETWLNNKYIPKFFNYISEWKHRGAAGGGLGILLHKEIHYKNLVITEYDGGVMEVQAIEVYIRNSDPIKILNIYNPNKNVTIDEMEFYLNQLGDRFLVAGDFNAHSAVLDTNVIHPNPTGITLENLLLNNNVSLINPVNMYTYLDRRNAKQSCLDLCLSSSELSTVLDITPFEDVGSDHLVLKVTANFEPDKYSWDSVPRYKLNEESIKQFNVHYIQSSCHQPNDIDSLVEDFMKRLTRSADDTFGIPTVPPAVKKKKTPWWNGECHTAVKKRRRLRKIVQNHPTDHNIEEYKKLTSEAKNIIKESKAKSFQDFVSNLTHNTPQSKIWKTIKAFKSTYIPQTYPLENNGNAVLTAMGKATMMNEHFKCEIEDDDDEYDHDIGKSCCEQENLLSCNISQQEFDEVLHSLKDKSPGHDLISNKILKECHSSYKNELLSIFNQSIRTGDVPKVWKLGYIILILKPTKPKEKCSSYRPITLLSCIGKFLEKILKARLEYHLEKGKMLDSSQFGFRPGKSTEGVVLKLTNQIQTAITSSNYCLVVYIDLKGAFDGVWRNGLLYKLTMVDIKGSILRWLRQYLTSRTQSVVIHGAISNVLPNDVGVPQGAVLSPLLFNVMMHDMPKDDNVEIYTFADDITLACSGNDLEEVQANMQAYIDILSSWFVEWKFVVNKAKTNMQLFTRRRKNAPIILLEGDSIEPVKEQRLLGLIFDAPRLTWKAHINHLVIDCTRRIDIMKAFSSSRFGASHVILRRFYVAYIRAKLCYCSAAFSTACKTQIKRLCTVQNACLRLILGARRSSPILSIEAECNMPPLNLYMDFLSARSYIKLKFGSSDDRVSKALLYDGSKYAENNKEILMRYNVQEPKRIHCQILSSIPPWLNIDSKIIMDFPFRELNKERFEEYTASNLSGFKKLFTDGSKITEPAISVSAGLFFSDHSTAISWKIHPQHTVVAAELYAIWKCLQYIDLYIIENCVVFTDSMTSLQMIGGKSRTYLDTVNKIRNLMIQLNKTREVVLHWVKAHIGIPGNETADKVANLGHNNDRSTLYDLHKEEFYNNLHHGFVQYWHQNWKDACETEGKGTFLRNIKNDIRLDGPVDTGSRKMDAILFRLRLGHAGLNKYLHKIGKSNTDLCTYCGDQETIEHFLVKCDEYYDQRSRLFMNITDIIKFPPERLTVKLLLGGEDFPIKVNRQITKALSFFVKNTGRAGEI